MIRPMFPAGLPAREGSDRAHRLAVLYFMGRARDNGPQCGVATGRTAGLQLAFFGSIAGASEPDATAASPLIA
jgi:hypothetical protein